MGADTREHLLPGQRALQEPDLHFSTVGELRACFQEHHIIFHHPFTDHDLLASSSHQIEYRKYKATSIGNTKPLFTRAHPPEPPSTPPMSPRPTGPIPRLAGTPVAVPPLRAPARVRNDPLAPWIPGGP